MATVAMTTITLPVAMAKLTVNNWGMRGPQLVVQEKKSSSWDTATKGTTWSQCLLSALGLAPCLCDVDEDEVNEDELLDDDESEDAVMENPICVNQGCCCTCSALKRSEGSRRRRLRTRHLAREDTESGIVYCPRRIFVKRALGSTS